MSRVVWSWRGEGSEVRKDREEYNINIWKAVVKSLHFEVQHAFQCENFDKSLKHLCPSHLIYTRNILIDPSSQDCYQVKIATPHSPENRTWQLGDTQCISVMIPKVLVMKTESGITVPNGDRIKWWLPYLREIEVLIFQTVRRT